MAKYKRRTKTTNPDGSKTTIVKRNDGSLKKVKTVAKDGELFRTLDEGGNEGYSKYKTNYKRNGSLKKVKKTNGDNEKREKEKYDKNGNLVKAKYTSYNENDGTLTKKRFKRRKDRTTITKYSKEIEPSVASIEGGISFNNGDEYRKTVKKNGKIDKRKSYNYKYK